MRLRMSDLESFNRYTEFGLELFTLVDLQFKKV
eukprot:CAMPEP_0116894968 /NCGR_PEP_ID=MMETSP0467-20121206/4605_1 /TAXON_ID=283647 /ORGANISM="Mesodinium pulex, Strain SPMC105" /LENGTH=32 /DNA_ID= /DNA_START= /DNA_END= /DNA_ORIENTATION=